MLRAFRIVISLGNDMLAVEEPKGGRGELVSMESFDPYLYHVPMPLEAVYYPLGFSVSLATNSKDVLAAAEESWGDFKQTFATPPLQIRIGVSEGKSTAIAPASTFRAQRNLVVNIADNENFCISDIAQGFSFAWLTKATVSQRSRFRYNFLEAAALCHIANRFTAPVHAACVELAGSGVMLCGDSGAGKSSLSFACARSGWTYITDDACFLLNGRNDRKVVGNCHLIRLRPSAADLFPEVEGKDLTSRPTGKPSIELLTASIPGIAKAVASPVDYVVFLNRNDPNVSNLTPFSKEIARRSMQQPLYGMDEMRKVQEASIERLLTAEVLELCYSDLDWAVDRLERLVREKR
jgi:hypothetical protein